MTRLPSGHRCISIEEFDPEGRDATAEGREVDAQFRAPGSERENGNVLAQDATRNVLAQATRHVLAPEATRTADIDATRNVLALDATRNILASETPSMSQASKAVHCATDLAKAHMVCGICAQLGTVKECDGCYFRRGLLRSSERR